jgi:HAE1 family hydrophobic/amphiphilic exporter-1
MSLTKLSINRPIAILMLVMAMMVLGWRSMKEMPAELNPSTNIPYVNITTTYAGAGPSEIETLVTKPLEDSIAAVNGIKNVTSQNQDGISMISIEFYLGINPDVAAADVRQKVEAARGDLPKDADEPIISKLDLNAQPVLTYGLFSKSLNSRELRDMADNVIQYKLAQVPGVGQVNISGGDKREIQVNVDKDRLAAYSLTIQDVVNAIQAGNLNMPGGHISEGARDYNIRTLGEFTSVGQLRNLRVSVPPKGPGSPLQVNLSDIATVKDTSAERDQIARVNEKDSVSLIISKLSDANPVQMADGVKKVVADMERTLPGGVQFVLATDTSRQVRAALEDVNVSLVLGALLAVMVVFLFLHNIRGTIIIAIAIPTSLIATFIPMKAFGFTLNQMTMLGLSLVVGILIDDSIVVLENIYRHLARGETPREAAINGRSEIGLAAVTITMVDVVVFVPIGFMGGIVGQFFRQFGLTVACATLFSLFVSFTFTPMLASRWYAIGEETEANRGVFGLINRFYKGLDEAYRRVLHWALGRDRRHSTPTRLAVILVGYGSLIVTMFFLGPHLGFQFIPVVDSGQIIATVELPPGASLEATDAITKKVEDVLMTVPEKDSVFTTVGYIAGGGFSNFPTTGRQYASLSLNLIQKQNLMDKIYGRKGKRTRSSEEIAQELRPKIAQIPGAKITLSAASAWGGAQAPIQEVLTGSDMNRIQQVAEQIQARIAKIPGIISTDTSIRSGKPEVQVHLDRVRAADAGVSVADAANAIRNSLSGNTDAKFREEGEEYDIRVQYQDLNRADPNDVGKVLVPTQRGFPAELRTIADISVGQGPTKIDRKNRMEEVMVSANLAPGYSTGNVQQQIDKAIVGIDMSGVSLGYGGDVQSQKEEFPFLLSALALGAILVYMLMAALFNSLLHPFTIMLSLPMALIGAIAALVIAHEVMSIIAMIGIIMLVGLVTKNAILLIDYTNTLRARGWDRDDAIEEAGPTRLRPILMTTIAMVLAMLPIALKIGEASEMRAPLAITVMGGLILSTMLTLLIIPVTYTLFDDVQRLFSRRSAPKRPRFGPTPKSGPSEETQPRTLEPEEVR